MNLFLMPKEEGKAGIITTFLNFAAMHKYCQFKTLFERWLQEYYHTGPETWCLALEILGWTAGLGFCLT